jgi:hypothetical protein
VSRTDLRGRVIAGAIAGFCATLPMTLLMRRLHRRLPEPERYPLTPREIVNSATKILAIGPTEEAAQDTTVALHFAFGALAGGAAAAALPRMGTATGATVGTGVWALSYLGWIPALRLLEPATQHPARRNAVMIAAHLLWGAATAAGTRELLHSGGTIFGPGPSADAPQR